MKKTKIEIDISYESESDFELALDEVVNRIKEGYLLGRDGNDSGSYSFAVVEGN